MDKSILTLMTVLLLSITSCSNRHTLYSTRSNQIEVENKYLSTELNNTKNIIELKRPKFNDEEWKSLTNTISTINILTTKYDAISELKSSEVSVADVDFLWQLAYEGFYQARSVVIAKYAFMPPSVRVMIDSFDSRVSEVDLELSSLVSNPSEENINNALVLIAGTLTYSAKMISTMATQL